MSKLHTSISMLDPSGHRIHFDTDSTWIHFIDGGELRLSDLLEEIYKGMKETEPGV